MYRTFVNFYIRYNDGFTISLLILQFKAYLVFEEHVLSHTPTHNEWLKIQLNKVLTFNTISVLIRALYFSELLLTFSFYFIFSHHYRHSTIFAHFMHDYCKSLLKIFKIFKLVHIFSQSMELFFSLLWN